MNALVSYKMNHISKRRVIFKIFFWTVLMLGLIYTEPLYNWLYSEGLTQTEALSLFDVILITATLHIFFLLNKLYVKVDILEKRVQDLHQELSILLSGNDKNRP
jgi:hypothetical protein